jgi:hypothetical protein
MAPFMVSVVSCFSSVHRVCYTLMLTCGVVLSCPPAGTGAAPRAVTLPCRL